MSKELSLYWDNSFHFLFQKHFPLFFFLKWKKQPPPLDGCCLYANMWVKNKWSLGVVVGVVVWMKNLGGTNCLRHIDKLLIQLLFFF